MDNLQKLAFRMSEVKQGINDIQVRAEPEDGDTAKLTAFTAEAQDLEVRYRAALVATTDLPEAGPITEEKPEVKEFNAIYHKSKLFRFLDSIAHGKELDGADAELRAAVFPNGSRLGNEHSFPLHLLLPLDEDLEVRVDTATTIAAASGVKQTKPIAERIFARTDSAFLGANFVAVQAGQQSFPYVSAGAALSYADEGVAIDAAAGTVTVEDVNPTEASLAYLYGQTSASRFMEGELESALRNDARMAIESGIDDTVIKGRPVVANVLTVAVPGLETEIAAGADEVADSLTAAAVLAIYAGRVDGLYANVWQDVRMLVRNQVYAASIFLAVGGATGERLLGDLLGTEIFRASSRLTNVAAHLSQGISYAPANDRMNLLVPVWMDVGVIVDPYTAANKRQTRLTFSVAHSVKVLRSDPWKRHGFYT